VASFFRQARTFAQDTAASLTLQYSSPVLNGSLLFCLPSIGQGVPTNVFDDQGNDWFPIGTVQSGGVSFSQLWAAFSEGNNQPNVTAEFSTGSPGNTVSISITEYAVAGLGLTFTAGDYGENNSNRVPTNTLVVSKTFSKANLLVILAGCYPNSEFDSVTPNTGLTLDFFGSSNQEGFVPIFASKTVSLAAQTGSVTTSGGRDAEAWLVGFAFPFNDASHSVDLVVQAQNSAGHNADLYVFIAQNTASHSVDLYVQGTGSPGHRCDLYVLSSKSRRIVVVPLKVNKGIVTSVQVDEGV
jgi:hypothetical protein